MRAAFVTCGGFDDLTGAGVYDRRLAGHLRERGDTVDVVSLPRRCYARSLGEGLSGGLAGTLAGGRYDAIIEDEQDHPSLLLLNRRLRRRAEGPIVAIVHRLRCRGRCPGAARLIFRRIEKLYLDSTDGIVCDSEIAHRAAGTLCPGDRPFIVAYPGRDRLPGRSSATPGWLRAGTTCGWRGRAAPSRRRPRRSSRRPGSSLNSSRRRGSVAGSASRWRAGA